MNRTIAVLFLAAAVLGMGLVQPSGVEAEPDGRLSRLMGLSLEAVPIGSYTLVLQATDVTTGETIQVREPFAVRP